MDSFVFGWCFINKVKHGQKSTNKQIFVLMQAIK